MNTTYCFISPFPYQDTINLLEKAISKIGNIFDMALVTYFCYQWKEINTYNNIISLFFKIIFKTFAKERIFKFVRKMIVDGLASMTGFF